MEVAAAAGRQTLELQDKQHKAHNHLPVEAQLADGDIQADLTPTCHSILVREAVAQAAQAMMVVMVDLLQAAKDV